MNKEYADQPIFFMCDGGDKLGEFKKFTPLLKQGSVIASHDWESVASSQKQAYRREHKTGSRAIPIRAIT